MNDQAKSEPKPKKTWKRRLAGVAIKLTLVVLFLEVALRVATFAAYQQNPYYLFYGFQGAVSQVNVSPWSVYAGRYYKYPPNYELQGAAGQKHETATTNSLGFRGRDFAPEKAPGTFRVFCTGGSSTFGFHNDDDQTYPHYLQELFLADEATRHIEVINAGFPYYNTATIRGLLEEELVRYDPDLVTVYSGYNDTSWPLEIGPWFRTVNWLQETSITCFVLKQTILTDKNIYRWFGRYWPKEDGTDQALMLDSVERTAARFRANLEAMLAVAKREGFQLVLIRQPITTVTTNKSFRGYTYEEEFEAVMAKRAAGEWLSRFDISLVRHHRLTEELDAFAEREGLTVVDNIALLDENRDLLASWVHLEAEANRRLAEELATTIAPLAAR